MNLHRNLHPISSYLNEWPNNAELSTNSNNAFQMEELVQHLRSRYPLTPVKIERICLSR